MSSKIFYVADQKGCHLGVVPIFFFIFLKLLSRTQIRRRARAHGKYFLPNQGSWGWDKWLLTIFHLLIYLV